MIILNRLPFTFCSFSLFVDAIMEIHGEGISGGFFGQKMEFHLSSLYGTNPSILSSAVSIAFQSQSGHAIDYE